VAKVVDFRIDQGSRWIAVIQPVVEWLSSLSGYSARGKVKASRTLPGLSVLFDFTPYMTVDEVGGLVVIDVPADITAAFSWDSGAYDFELHDADPAHDVRFLQGNIKVDKEVTTP
jgi:hypothetical protein